jgi:hypothetical protein
LNDLERFLHDRNCKGLDSIAKDIEDELDIFLRLFILLCADDTVLFFDSAEDLQVQLNNFSEYCDTWRLKVNISKTDIVAFTRARLHHFKFSYKGSNLEIVLKVYIYLGIFFSSTDSYLNTKKEIVGKATKIMYEVLKKSRVHNISIKCQYDQFDKMVKLILLYGCELWGFGNNDIIERAYPMSIYIKLRMVIYWSNLINGKDSKLSLILYNNMYIKNVHDLAS